MHRFLAEKPALEAESEGIDAAEKDPRSGLS